MKKLFYPALFHNAEEGGFWITFPDLPECITEGDDMDQGYEMAADALGLAITSRLESNAPLPLPSRPDTIQTEKGSFITVIEFDMEAYKKRTNQKAVKKTLSIPGWLNEEASSLGINFSQVLQEALINEIQARN